MSDGDEKKPGDDDSSFLEELGDLLDENQDPTEDSESPGGGEDELELAEANEWNLGELELEETASELPPSAADPSTVRPEDVPDEEVPEEEVIEFLDPGPPEREEADDIANLELVEEGGEAFSLVEEELVEEELVEEELGAVGLVEPTVPFEPLGETTGDEPVDAAAVDAGAEDVELDFAESAANIEPMIEEVGDSLPGSEAAEFEPLDALAEIEVPAADPGVEEAGSVDATPGEFDEETAEPVVAAVAANAAGPAAKKKPTKPFELREPEAYDRMTVAPPVPAKRKWGRDLLKVGIGLVLGAIALQIGLWWGLGKDPLGLSQLAPSWTLPSSLKDGPLAAVPRTSTPATDVPSDLNAESVTSTSPSRDSQFDETSADLVADDLASSTRPADDPDGTAPAENSTGRPDPLADFPVLEQPQVSSTEGSGTSEAGVAGEGSGTTASETATDPSDDAFAGGREAVETGQVASPLDKPGPKNSATYTRNDLAAAIARARMLDEKLDEARVGKSPDLRAAAVEFYRAFANLGEKATYVSRAGAEEVLASSRELLSSFEFDETKQRMIGNATRNWIKKELGIGVFGAANVTGIQRMGDLYKVDITLMGKAATPITVVTRLDPESNDFVRYSVGDRILFLGTVVKNAKERIEGYNGMDDSVVWLTDQVVTIP